jgi:hypothetical protein
VPVAFLLPPTNQTTNRPIIFNSTNPVAHTHTHNTHTHTESDRHTHTHMHTHTQSKASYVRCSRRPGWRGGPCQWPSRLSRACAGRAWGGGWMSSVCVCVCVCVGVCGCGCGWRKGCVGVNVVDLFCAWGWGVGCHICVCGGRGVMCVYGLPRQGRQTHHLSLTHTLSLIHMYTHTHLYNTHTYI